MPDPQIWDSAKYVGGAGAAIISIVTSIRMFLRTRNGSATERITNLELARREDRRVMAELKRQLEDMQVTLSSTENRVRRVEVSQYDLERELRDDLKRMIEKIDRRLRLAPESAA